MSEGHFSERLFAAVERKRSHVVVGLDPNFESLPADIVEAHPPEAYDGEEAMKAACCLAFLLELLDSVREEAVAVKPQAAYFEALGVPGYEAYLRVVVEAKERGLLVIADVKRGDIGSTAEAYAAAHLDVAGADAMTVNPYFGSDGLEPFLRRTHDAGKGVFVLVKTSNPTSAEIQDRELASGITVYQQVAGLVNEWGRGTEGPSGYRSVGAVVGGTHPAQGAELRSRMPGVPFLIPGYGAQGARAEDLAQMFDERGSGAVVNSARAILYAYLKHPGLSWQEAARREAGDMRAALWKAAGRG